MKSSDGLLSVTPDEITFSGDRNDFVKCTFSVTNHATKEYVLCVSAIAGNYLGLNRSDGNMERFFRADTYRLSENGGTCYAGKMKPRIACNTTLILKPTANLPISSLPTQFKMYFASNKDDKYTVKSDSIMLPIRYDFIFSISSPPTIPGSLPFESSSTLRNSRHEISSTSTNRNKNTARSRDRDRDRERTRNRDPYLSTGSNGVQSRRSRHIEPSGASNPSSSRHYKYTSESAGPQTRRGIDDHRKKKLLDRCSQCLTAAPSYSCNECSPSYNLCLDCVERGGLEAHTAHFGESHEPVFGFLLCIICQTTANGVVIQCACCTRKSSTPIIMCQSCASDPDNLSNHVQGKDWKHILRRTASHPISLKTPATYTAPSPYPGATYDQTRDIDLRCNECNVRIRNEFFGCSDCNAEYLMCDRCANYGGIAKHLLHTLEFFMPASLRPQTIPLSTHTLQSLPNTDSREQRKPRSNGNGSNRGNASNVRIQSQIESLNFSVTVVDDSDRSDIGEPEGLAAQSIIPSREHSQNTSPTHSRNHSANSPGQPANKLQEGNRNGTQSSKPNLHSHSPSQSRGMNVRNANNDDDDDARDPSDSQDLRHLNNRLDSLRRNIIDNLRDYGFDSGDGEDYGDDEGDGEDTSTGGIERSTRARTIGRTGINGEGGIGSVDDREERALTPSRPPSYITMEDHVLTEVEPSTNIWNR